MSPPRRLAIGLVLLTSGYAAQAGLEALTVTERPALRRPLDSIPGRLGTWVGRDEPMDPEVLEKTQATDYLNRIYEDTSHPGRRVGLWINYSEHGLNLRHSPEVCLPSGGWTKVESLCRVVGVDDDSRAPGRASKSISLLAYSKGELVQGIGFWYYIFGEGRVENYVRGLPITSRSSHGRTTRGSGLTVEVFCPADEAGPDAEALRRFAGALLEALGPILPEPRAEYYIP